METLLPSPSWALMGSQGRFLPLWPFFCHQHSTFHIFFSVPGLDPFFLLTFPLYPFSTLHKLFIWQSRLFFPSRLWCFPRLSSCYTSAAIWASLVCKGQPGREMLLARRQGLMASEHTSIWNWFWPLYIFWYKETDTAKNNRWAAGRIIWPIHAFYPEETGFYFWALQTLSWLKIFYFFRSSRFILVVLFLFSNSTDPSRFNTHAAPPGRILWSPCRRECFPPACSQGLPYGPVPQGGSVAAGFSVILLSTQLSVP